MKDTFYFQHDYNARNDQKILKLRDKFNNLEGYALFFMILESMAEEENGYIDRGAIGGLSLGYSIPKETLLQFIDFCIEIKLFYEDEKGIYSQRMIEHKNTRKLLSDKGKEGAKKRWGNRVPIGEANAKERKGKESKVKESNYIFNENKFEEFWNTYDKKVGKTKTIEYLKKHKLTDEEVDTVIEKTKLYKERVSDSKYRKDPERWIRDKLWLDEEIQEKPKYEIHQFKTL